MSVVKTKRKNIKSVGFLLALRDQQTNSHNIHNKTHLRRKTFLHCQTFFSLLGGSIRDGKVNCPLKLYKEPWVSGYKPRPNLKGRFLPIVWEKATHPLTCPLFMQEHSSSTQCLFSLSDLSTSLSHKNRGFPLHHLAE